MSQNFTNLTVVNSAKSAQHPFHLLGSSKLPLFMSIFAGGLAITLIIKLQNVVPSKFFLAGSVIMEPFFSVAGALPNMEIPDSIVDARLVTFLTFILLTI
jgi:hypothetical protein